MRDPARIDRILALLEAYWKKYPDLRLGQIVCNLSTGHAHSVYPKSADDVFSLEDTAIEAQLTKELGVLTALAAVAKEPKPKKGDAGVK